MSDTASKNFIEEIVEENIASGLIKTPVTRFPPEPNGYLHIGHAKAICLDFGIAKDYGGTCHLRMDDTNPSKEDTEYVESIMEDVRWLGWNWGDHLYYASDYFQQIYEWAVYLIKQGKAFVCDHSADEVRQNRGTLTEPGVESPFRSRSVEENLDLFERMKNGEFAEGTRVLRAKIDMAHPNLNMRDPVLYRIVNASHHRTGDKWHVYPMYDFAHGQSDAIEGITHSLCTLEFEDHRPLYNWYIENLPVPHKPRQIEFARLNITYTVMSKRKLLQLVKEKHVSGWDDPRMPTICGLRRRGYTPAAIREFAARAGLSKRPQTVDLALLDFCLRQDLEESATRRMAVIDPLKVVITNFPEETEFYEGQNHPSKSEEGSRKVPLTKEIYIDRDDFMENPPKKFFRLFPGGEVRLRYACYITCTEVVKDADGNVTELRATFDPESRGATTPDNRKVKGTIHWVSATENTPLEIRLYDTLFSKENPDDVAEGGSFLDNINPDSLKVVRGYGEVDLAHAKPGEHFQFERRGYFCIDKESKPGAIVVNRTTTLRDVWGKRFGDENAPAQ
ncbi:MAG: glutamine--tRNA ligase/YqeY domain fusion protein [Opitutales bacterium]|jgi:glutaminyl-tRNA synthetase